MHLLIITISWLLVENPNGNGYLKMEHCNKEMRNNIAMLYNAYI